MTNRRYNLHEIFDLVSKHEGMRLRPYRDTVGKLTIGYGRNLEDKGISEGEAREMLYNDIVEAEHELDRDLPWWKDLSPERQKVLVSMVFNLGINRLLGFRKALAAMQAGDWKRAAAEMLDSKWAGQVGDRADELAGMMETG